MQRLADELMCWHYGRVTAYPEVITRYFRVGGIRQIQFSA